MLTKEQQSVARRWRNIQKVDEAARELYAEKDRLLRNLARSVLGGKKSATVKIGAVRGLKIVNQFQSSDKIFFKGFTRKYDISEIKLR